MGMKQELSLPRQPWVFSGTYDVSPFLPIGKIVEISLRYKAVYRDQIEAGLEKFICISVRYTTVILTSLIIPLLHRIDYFILNTNIKR